MLKVFAFFLPQVTVQYRQDRGAMVPLRIHTIVVSVQHDEAVTLEEMHRCLKEQVVKAVVPSGYLDDDTIYHLQPSGRFVIGGPQVRLVTLLCSWRRRKKKEAAVKCSGHADLNKDG